MQVKVSIIVPVYNVRDYLRECLDTLVGQTLDGCQIILVNDGSTDDSGDICKEYAQRHESITYLCKENGGQSSARNLGMSVASGEYILFVDSDDYITPDACEILYGAAIKSDADIVVGDILNEKERIESDEGFRRIPSENERVDVREFARQALEHGVYDIVPWIRLVRREVLLENGISFLEGCFYEDQEYTLRLMTLSGVSAIKIRCPFYYYRIGRQGSTTTHTSAKKGTDFLAVIEKMNADIAALDSEGRELGARILGIAYYHYAQVWLRLDSEARREQRPRLLRLIEECSESERAIESLSPALSKTVRGLIHSPRRLVFDNAVRGFFRKIKRAIGK
ncbi:MAG: glycosyltransferase [Clostridia bacterium]|nr:glycosyltransferase [Clostridia bacterium]